MRYHKGISALLFCLLLAPAILAADGGKDKGLLNTAQIYFDSGQFQLALNAYEEFLKESPPGPEANRAIHYTGRALFGIAMSSAPGKRREIFEEARRYLRQITREEKDSEYYLESIYWLGKISFEFARIAGVNGDDERQQSHLLQAIRHFNAVMDTNTGLSPLNFNARYDHARAHMSLAKLPQPERKRAELYGEAIQGYELLIINYPTHARRVEIEYNLIDAMLQARRYPDAIEACQNFQRQFPESPLVLEVRFRQAESLYYSGRLKEAVQVYDSVITETSPRPGQPLPPLTVQAYYGKGWSYARMAATAGRERQQQYLGAASISFLAALESEHFRQSPEYKPAVYKYAETLVLLHEYDEARRLLRNILESPAYRLRASFLAGQAAEGAHAYGAAHRHFDRSRQLSIEEGNNQIYLDALARLGEIELAWGRPERAILYAREALELASLVRDYGNQAKGRMNVARSLLGIATPKDNSLAGRDDDPFLYLFTAARGQGAGLAYALKQFYYARNAERLRERYSDPGRREEALLEAARMLDILIERHARRLRLDEVLYYKGRILFRRAQLRAARLQPLGGDLTLTSVAAGEVRDKLGEAGGVIIQALEANPKGTFAGAIQYELGRTRLYAGEAYQKFYMAFMESGEDKTAETYLVMAKQSMEEAIESLQRAMLHTGEEGRPRAARFLLGLGYLKLQRYAQAEATLRELLGDSQLEGELRIRTVLTLAEVLDEDGRLEEAIEIFELYLPLEEHTPTTILRLGDYLQRNDRLSAARRIYLQMESLPQPPEKSSDYEKYIEGLVEGYGLSLYLSRDAEDGMDMAAPALRKLRELARTYPDSPFAARALAREGDYYLHQEDYQQALTVAREGREILATAEGEARMLILAGEILVDSGRMEEGLESFRKAYDVKISSPGGQRLQAKALLLQARTQLRLGKEGTDEEKQREHVANALKNFARVYAEYAGLKDLADQARVEAALYLADHNQTERAILILEDMNGKARAVRLLRDIRSGNNNNETTISDDAPGLGGELVP